MCHITAMREHKKTAIVRARVSAQLKDESEAILEKLGVTSSQAISMFLSQVVLKKGLPFEAILRTQSDSSVDPNKPVRA